jgi:predicted small lipoprotein YifL
MRRMFVAAGALAALGALSLGLAGCGKLGSLERPGPMLGQAPVKATQPSQRQDPNRPVVTIDPRDPDATPGQDQPTPPVPGVPGAGPH